MKISVDKMDALRNILKSFINWVPESVDLKSISIARYGKKNGMWTEGDDKFPLVSEAYSYNLFGKEDARTLRYYVSELLRIAEMDTEEF